MVRVIACEQTQQRAATPVESGDEDAEFRAALQAQAESEEDDAAVSEVVVPKTRGQSGFLSRRIIWCGLYYSILDQKKLA